MKRRRTSRRAGARTGDASDADARVVHKQLGYDTGRIGWERIDTSGAPEQVRARAAAALGLKGS